MVPSLQDKAAFREKWFGNYRDLMPSEFLVAQTHDGVIAGYLAGCVDSFSTTSAPIVDAIDYYQPSLLAKLVPYPSHFHINVDPAHQARGIGKQLVARFVSACEAAGSSGVHVVTGASTPAARFYRACGFVSLRFPAIPTSLSVLGRAATPP